MADLRTRRTDISIQNAFVSLVLAKGFKNVTVIDIAKEAMINRQTFYKHYQDKYQLAEKMMTDFANKYDQLLKKRIELTQQHQDFMVIQSLFTNEINQTLRTHSELIRALKMIQFDHVSLDQSLKQVIATNLPLIMGHQPSKFEMALLTALILGIFDYVIAGQKLPEPVEVKAAIHDILTLLGQ
ncbi:MAG: TetR/AcrR family transcriptional regulator [Lactobacillus sp.]|jgi:AcrR family transcriptional regulator|nr:TetR/AcrR family transcriptional regulator [Lactobacillus sp.]